ncbi:alpha/beta fold hydrolase [Viridibacillus sp. YIM B01967]|uniref:Alpha/beta fold hydrolase n=1 Tax=Viridibacillus soli TaxID=2798301 RepID=A0ABS1H538_9BACL|nr:alpha/beta fold hydrolase [Viridibacillus soli]MBK3494516.1 alpha/beta fold hydrolase [Viridibacillus soli]
MTTGILCIHGFTGGPHEVQPFVDFLQKKTDWVVYVPTLSGHGDKLSLENYKAEHWLMDAELAYKKLAKEVDEVIVVGFSMGGLIALYLTLRYNVKKLVLLSAAAKYISVRQLLKDFKTLANDLFQGELANNELFHRYESKISHVPMASTVEFLRLVRKVEPYYEKIKVPVCLVQGEVDGIVPAITAQFLYDKLGSTDKQLIISPNGKHHICYSDDCNEWFQNVLNFILKP